MFFSFIGFFEGIIGKNIYNFYKNGNRINIKIFFCSDFDRKELAPSNNQTQNFQGYPVHQQNFPLFPVYKRMRDKDYKPKKKKKKKSKEQKKKDDDKTTEKHLLRSKSR